jgi:outer membrane protein OmpA-like peptidoglycan-associated protein
MKSKRRCPAFQSRDAPRGALYADTKTMLKTTRYPVGVIVLALAFWPQYIAAEEFFYKHETGDKYRIISTVEEDVYFNRRFDHHSLIINRIAAEVTGVENDVAEHKALFQTAEKAEGIHDGQSSFQWDREYSSEFSRDRRGYLQVDEQYFMPMTRNVPVFPDTDLKHGDTWAAEGNEVHDFRDTFGINEPYRIPFTANYTMLGDREWRGKNYPAFSISYRVFAEPPAPTAAPATEAYPTRIMGASDQVMYWDTALGQPVAYEEHFRMVFELSNGNVIEYRGHAEAEIIEAETMDKKSIAETIADELVELGLDDEVSVRESDEGITLSFDNIQFPGDSAELLPSEQAKLDKISAILLRYGDRDILVGGHTALAGTAEGRAKLSRDRAASVADYLIERSVRAADRVIVRGYGAERPIADNRTEEGRQQNRRVELTILEN